MKTGRTPALAALLVLAVMLVPASGCGGGGAGGGLEGVEWALESYVSEGVMEDVPPGATVTALFEDGTVGGSSGVNTYGGPYTVSGGALEIGELASTMMAGPPELMELEQAYLSALREAASFEAAGGELTLLDGGGEALLVFGR